jgi:hypothetical protein
LRVTLQSWYVALVYDEFSWLTNQLVDRRHENKLHKNVFFTENLDLKKASFSKLWIKLDFPLGKVGGAL